MAQKTVVLLEDDLDGGPAEETVTFALDGVSYVLDLSSANAAQLRDVFRPYLAAGRRVGGQGVPTRRRSGGGGPARTDREQLAAIRAWARGRGMTVNDRGRIPAHIVEQYHGGAAIPAPEPPPEAAFSDAPTPRRKAKKTD